MTTDQIHTFVILSVAKNPLGSRRQSRTGCQTSLTRLDFAPFRMTYHLCPFDVPPEGNGSGVKTVIEALRGGSIFWAVWRTGGSLVLEMPLRLTTRVTALSAHAATEFVFVSSQEGPLRAWRRARRRRRMPKWVRYSYGCLLLFCDAQHWKPKAGLKFSIRSRVPASMGVSGNCGGSKWRRCGRWRNFRAGNSRARHWRGWRSGRRTSSSGAPLWPDGPA